MPEPPSQEVDDASQPACARCGAVVSLSARYCEQCGAPLQRPSEIGSDRPRSFPRERESGERRLVTVLFCDLIDSTARATRLDVEDVALLMRTFQDTCASAIAPFGGFIAQTLGDGMMVYFGFPEAHESDAERAVHAGLAIAAAIANPRGALRKLWDECAVRVGIHTGVVFAGVVSPWDTRADKALVGDTPAIAARLQQLAGRSEVVVGPRTHELVQGHFELTPLGLKPLKGLRDPIPVWRVVRPQGLSTRFAARSGRAGASPFVGRASELSILRKCWTQAAQGCGQAVLVTGNAGIGKSRLVEALHADMDPAQRNRRSYQCSPFFQHTALHPFVEQVREAAGIDREDPDALKLDKLEALLGATTDRVEGDLELLARLLRIEHVNAPQLEKHTAQRMLDDTVELLIEQLLRLARQRPLLVVLEDAHWMDHTTRGLLRRLLKRSAGTRLLLLITDRNGMSELPRDQGELLMLPLDRLGPESCVAIVEHLSAHDPLPRQLVDKTVSMSDGIPLFVEELTKVVLESRGSAGPLELPLSLKELLAARLDRIGPFKLIAQLGACIGRSFSYDLLLMLANVDEDRLREGLLSLEGAQLLSRSGDFPYAVFSFRHALLQSAAHESILLRERRVIHASIADRLERSFPRICEEEPEVLAYHMVEAGNHEAAARYWFRAGRAAQARSAHVEAIAHFDQAVAALRELARTPELDVLETDVQLGRAHSHTAGEGWGGARVTEAYNRALHLARSAASSAKECEILWGLCADHTVRGKFEAACALADDYVRLAEREGDRPALLMADSAAVMAYFCLGHFATAQRHADRIHALYRPDEDRELVLVYNHDPEVIASMYEGFWLWVQGHPDRAAHASRHCVEHAKRLDHPFQRCYALVNGVGAFLWRREHDQVAALLDEAMRWARDDRIPLFRGYAPLMAAPALIEREPAAETVALLERSLADMRKAGVTMHVPLYLLHVALAHQRSGDLDTAAARVAEALRAVEETAERWIEPEIRRVRAHIIACSSADSDEQVEHELRDALRRAQLLGARGFELRAACDLYELLARQDRKREARDLLSPSFVTFREGLGTHDLRRARALLE